MPSFFTYLALAETVRFAEAGILLLWAAQYSSMFFADEIRDYPEEKSMKPQVGTPAVRWGVRRTSLVALVIFSAMSPLILFSTYLVYGFSTFILSLPFFLAYLYVFRDLRSLYLFSGKYEKELTGITSTERKDLAERMPAAMKRLGKKTYIWIVIIGIPILAVKIIDLVLMGI